MPRPIVLGAARVKANCSFALTRLYAMVSVRGRAVHRQVLPIFSPVLGKYLGRRAAYAGSTRGRKGMFP